MLDCRSVTLGYTNHQVIKDFTFTFEKNKRYAIIGPSGCGKTTLLYGLAGIVQSMDGRISIDGEQVKKSRKKTSIILQEYGLFPWKTVWQNIRLPLEIRRALNAETIRSCEQLMTTLELSDKRDAYPSQLSGGQKQRVAIARSWSTSPDLLLMDEPFSSLDAMTREALQDSLLELQVMSEMTMIMVTHSIEEAVYMADKIIVMKKDGSLDEIIDNPMQGALTYREDDAYFDTCLKLRHALQGGRNEK